MSSGARKGQPLHDVPLQRNGLVQRRQERAASCGWIHNHATPGCVSGNCLLNNLMWNLWLHPPPKGFLTVVYYIYSVKEDSPSGVSLCPNLFCQGAVDASIYGFEQLRVPIHSGIVELGQSKRHRSICHARVACVIMYWRLVGTSPHRSSSPAQPRHFPSTTPAPEDFTDRTREHSPN